MSLAALKPWLRRVPGFRQMGNAIRIAVSPRFRSEWRLRQAEGAAFQYSTVTADNRYPRIFAFVRDQLADRDRPRVLSFGCSTGEEVFSLRRYMPAADITGIDINPWAISLSTSIPGPYPCVASAWLRRGMIRRFAFTSREPWRGTAMRRSMLFSAWRCCAMAT